MRELPHGQVGVVLVGCDYCRNQEQLPAELGARVLVLRARLEHLAAARDALQGPAKFVAQLSDARTWLPTLLVPIAAILVQLPATFNRLRPALENQAVSPETKAELLGAALNAPAYVSGMILGMLLGLFATRWHYARALRPHYLARAPMQAGLPTRCRRCGGNLPPAAGAFTTCPHCRAQNLVTPEIASHRVELLQREAAEYTARAHSAQEAFQQAAASSKWIYWACWGAGAGLGLALGYLARSAAVYLLLNYELVG
jgi:hypothetical protein